MIVEDFASATTRAAQWGNEVGGGERAEPSERGRADHRVAVFVRHNQDDDPTKACDCRPSSVATCRLLSYFCSIPMCG